MKSIIKKLWGDTKAAKSPSLSIAKKRFPALPANQIPLPTSNGFVIKDIADIIFVTTKGKYSEVYFKDNTCLVVNKNLKSFNKTLITHGFFPINGSFTVQLRYISKYVRAEGGYVVMCNNSTIPISKNKKKEFIRLFNGFYKT